MAKKILIMILIACLLTGCETITPAEMPTSTEGTENAVRQEGNGESLVANETYDYTVNPEDASLWGFSKQLFAQNMNETNPVLSPVSVYLAMGMVGLGAAGDTLAEFEAVMGEDMHHVSENLMQTLPVEPEVVEGSSRETTLHINLANSVWIDDAMEPALSWLDAVTSGYAAEVYHTKLSTEATMQQINKWIDEKSNGLINKFLSTPLEASTRMALFNTIYFYGEWQSAFSANSTKQESFMTADGTEVMVDMMNAGKCNRYYVAQENYDGVVLPYRDGNAVFVALKPTAGQTVREMYADLTKEELSGMLAVEATTLINLKLPKFEITFDKTLNESLQSMGIVSAFDGSSADFSNIGTSKDSGNLYINTVHQKAVIRVDEKGTEAAAVTGVLLGATGALREEIQPIDVYFDEPFLYMIVDTEEEVPLFVGIMDCPE